jgi:hypothetical protein
MPRIRFKFEHTQDLLGGSVLRPMVGMRLETAPVETRHMFLVDTGSPDTMIAWEEAEKAGIDPTEGEIVEQPDGFSVGGRSVIEIRGFTLNFLVEDDRYFIRLPNVPILVVRPWEHPGFTAVLGTRAMDSIRLEINFSEGWLEVTPEGEIQPEPGFPPATALVSAQATASVAADGIRDRELRGWHSCRPGGDQRLPRGLAEVPRREAGSLGRASMNRGMTMLPDRAW